MWKINIIQHNDIRTGTVLKLFWFWCFSKNGEFFECQRFLKQLDLSPKKRSKQIFGTDTKNCSFWVFFGSPGRIWKFGRPFPTLTFLFVGVYSYNKNDLFSPCHWRFLLVCFGIAEKKHPRISLHFSTFFFVFPTVEKSWGGARSQAANNMRHHNVPAENGVCW